MKTKFEMMRKQLQRSGLRIENFILWSYKLIIKIETLFGIFLSQSLLWRKFLLWTLQSRIKTWSSIIIWIEKWWNCQIDSQHFCYYSWTRISNVTQFHFLDIKRAFIKKLWKFIELVTRELLSKTLLLFYIIYIIINRTQSY